MKSRMSICAVVTTLVLAAFVSSQAGTRRIEAPITAVTVYRNQAGITRSTEMDLEQGEHSITIGNLPMAVLEESFRASTSGTNGVVILGLKHRLEQHLESPQERVADLEKQIRTLETVHKQSITDRIESFTQQKELLTAITKGSSSQMSDQLVKGGLDVSQWGEAYKFIGRGMRETNDSIRVANRELYEVEQQLDKLKKELKELKNPDAKTTRTVEIDIRAMRAGKVRISLDYVIKGATWQPLYDARLVDDNHVELSYLAEVKQNTGEDWENVDLTLSTSSPSETSGPGEFVAWTLSLPEFVDKYSPTVDELLEEVAGVQTTASGDVFIRGGRAGEVSYIVDGIPLGERLVSALAYSVVFTAGRKETVPSWSEAVRTTISHWQLDAETKLLCRPRNREAAYRIATIVNQSEAPLLPGKVSLFAETDFLGNAWIVDYIAPNEKFELPFGADKNIEVKREDVSYKKGEAGGMFSSKGKIEKTIKITLTNHSADERTIEVEEAVPVSQDERIKVKLEDPKPKPIAIDEKGKATWKVTLAPQEAQEILLPYRVEFPQGQRLQGM